MTKKIVDLTEENARDFLRSTFDSHPYSLHKDINRYIEESTTSALFEIRTGGSEGGDCWGNHTHSFSVSSREQQEDLVYEIKHKFITRINEYTDKKYDPVRFEKILEDIAKDNQHNSVNTNSSYGDYYGNGSDYDIIAIPIMETLRKILDYTDYCTVENVFEEERLARFNELNQTKNKEDLEKVTKIIKDFEKTKNQDAKKLQKEIEDAKKRVSKLEKDLANFDKIKSKELEKLEETENNLKVALGITSKSAANKKKN